MALSAIMLAAWSCGAMGADLFRPLTIDGAEVRWLAQQSSPQITLRYAIANRDIVTADAANCPRVRAPNRLLEKSSLAMADIRKAVAEAARRWQRAANISFLETSDAANADVVIGEQAEPNGLAFTNLTLMPPTGATVRGIWKAQICLNPNRPWTMGFDGNLTTYDLTYAISHEIGHAIGLDHPSARGHLMSFKYLEVYDELSAGDSLGAVSLYGARKAPIDSAAAPSNDGVRAATPRAANVLR